MQLRVSVVEYVDGARRRLRNVGLTIDVTQPVGELARALVRGGIGHPRLLPFATHRQATLTLRVTLPGGTLILDAGDTIASAGLVSGCTVEPVLETYAGAGPRARPPTALLTVLGGAQRGVRFLAAGPECGIGRERGNRIELHDPEVSRRHAVIRRVGGAIEIEDLGSANGIALIDAEGGRVPSEGGRIRIAATAVVEIGAVPVRVEVAPPALMPEGRVPAARPLSAGSAGPPAPGPACGVAHLPAPLVEPVYAPEELELSEPPDPPDPARAPLIALVAPLIMGLILFLTTRSTLSLVFVALSPLMLLGSWFDGRATRRRAHRASQREFARALRAAERQLAARADAERTARAAEAPGAQELAALPASGGARLWSRRREHGQFLQVRLGEARLPSRQRVRPPPRGRGSGPGWDEIERVRVAYARVDGVPLIEDFARCGSLGIAGPESWAWPAARAVLVQLLALHSPADLVIGAFAPSTRAERDWGWLAWVPHAGSAFSPLPGPHLAADPESATRLLAALEGLAADRGQERRPVGPAVVVLVLEAAPVDLARLVALAERGPDAGVHVLWVAATPAALPAACRTVLEVGQEARRVHRVRDGEVVELDAAEALELAAAEVFARALAPIVDAGARPRDATDLPRSIGLARLRHADILGSAEAILREWRDTDSLVAEWVPGAERASGGLAAVIGQGATGPVEIDLRAHGPHALVGGTTGSGKSEFLQTWIMSLAARYAPDRVNFLLVDYKGGAAFADCVGVPHAVGLVTDLTPRLARRVLTSLRAELRRREEILADRGAKDLEALERRGDRDAPAALVIVIDEFAALVREVPEFVDGVIDVAQRGRSLGLHLIMATQRPAGVIKENLRANTSIRVALRMSDTADSRDVLGADDAAGFPPEIPGRAALRIGAGGPAHFQAAYLGGRAGATAVEIVEVRELGFGERAAWSLVPEIRRAPTTARARPRDIEVLARTIARAARLARTRKPRRPWLDELPEVLPLGSPLLRPPDLGAHDGPSAGAGVRDGSRGQRVVIGLQDEPESQAQRPLWIDLAGGNVAFFGGVGSGKTTALFTLVTAAIKEAPGAAVYGIDCAGGRLGALSRLPNTGEIVPGGESGDRDRMVRVLGLVEEVIARRAHAAEGAREAPLLLLVDGIAAFRDAHEHLGGGADPVARLVRIAAAGRAARVLVGVTVERSNGLPASLAAHFPDRFALAQASAEEARVLGVPSDADERAGPGRAVRVGDRKELQLALPGVSGEAVEIDAALEAIGGEMRRQGAVQATRVPPLPLALSLDGLGPAADGRAPFGVDTVRLEPVAVPRSGLALVTGPAGSGRTTALRTLLSALARSEPQFEAVLLAPRRSALRDLPLWAAVADAPDERTSMIEALAQAFGPHGGSEAQSPAAAGPGARAPAGRSAVRGRRVIVVEDVGGFEGTGDEQRLAALLKALRTGETTAIVEGENATLGAVWEIAAALRGARWALALQPDANDTPSVLATPFTHARRADFPPGRGYLLEGGRMSGVHVALPETPVRAA
ncbi:FtsK/SpoIIIE domain-containing protein [Leucobacter luti]|uniref:FtsK/SpoIIIE domain-containing protein n=1 Tax=Leucobacter luti TaxID=340320 RepID=UPI003D0422A1